STTEAVVYGMALGFAYGSFQAINAAVYAHYFGRQHAGEIRGVTFVITPSSALRLVRSRSGGRQHTAVTPACWSRVRHYAPLPSWRILSARNRSYGLSLLAPPTSEENPCPTLPSTVGTSSTVTRSLFAWSAKRGCMAQPTIFAS